MKFTKIGKMSGWQDGDTWGDRLFRFDHTGQGEVFRTDTMEKVADAKLEGTDRFLPHCNTVAFGTQYYEKADPFPLLYCNAYNNYAEARDRREGVCGVYRILPDGDNYTLHLVQILKIGFTEDLTLWKSLPENGDVRPYGNFLVDTETGDLCAYTMRDADRTTRLFFFDVPAPRAGQMSEEYGVPVFTLTEEDVKDRFDAPYSVFIQGGIYRGGIVYSSEGFGSPEEPPVIRLFSRREKRQIREIRLMDYGLKDEAELVTFFGDRFVYSDGYGETYEVEGIDE